ncbi:MAG: signal peptidase [Thermoleophilia bacterium]|nr:signal peptidase [Thermoleophilia bacterium]
MERDWSSALRRLLTSRALLAVLIAIALVNVGVFAVQRWVVLPLSIPSPSMEPNLREGDRILMRRSHDEVADLRGRIDRGDVLVFRAPHTGRPLVVKRVIGLPGETIEAHDGIVAINNSRILVEKWLPTSEREQGSSGARAVDIGYVRLREDEVFVMGDNRDDSIDSRSFGPVKLSDVEGTVSLRIWPLGRFGTVDWS